MVWQVSGVLIEYTQAEQPKDPPPEAVRVCRRSLVLPPFDRTPGYVA